MNRFNPRLLATFASACAFAVGASLAQAQTDGPSSLQALCPGAAEQLADSLDRVAREHREVSNVFVTLSVKHQRISEVELFGADSTYQRAVKHAVRGLRCQAAGSGADQTVRAQFVVQFAVPPALAALPASAPVALRR